MPIFDQDYVAGSANEVVDRGRTFTLVPPGEYTAIIVGSDVVQKENGKLLSLTLSLLDDKYGGQKVFDNFWLDHKNPKAKAMGKAVLDNLCAATNRASARASEEFHDIPIRITVFHEEYLGKKKPKVGSYLPTPEGVRSVAATFGATSIKTEDMPF